MRGAKLLVPAAGLCLALLATSCGGGDVTAADERPRESSIVLPSQVLGLTVGTEDISASLEQQADQPFIDSVGLFAFRRGEDLLEATLQVSRFSSSARPEDSEFRGSIISRIGGTNPRLVRAGNQPVYLTSGRNQVVFIWFRDRGLFVLTTRRDYAFSRTLLRKLIELDTEV